jgi:Tfp pilus assembly protein PilO
MLEVKKDRLKEIDKQIKKTFKCKYAINLKPLYDEKKDLKSQIQKMEAKYGR